MNQNRILPSARVRTSDQMKVLLVAGRTDGPFVCRQIEVPGVSDHRKGLAMGFLVSCGFLVRLRGRGIYRPGPAARDVAEVWELDTAAGRRVLAGVLSKMWFAEVASDVLQRAEGTSRVGLADYLVTEAGATASRRQEGARLVEWLEHAGLVVPAGGDRLQWAQSTVAAPIGVAQHSGLGSVIRALSLAGDWAELASRSSTVGDLLRLSEQEVLDLHRGLRSLCAR